MEKSD
jgi:hypothetical protein